MPVCARRTNKYTVIIDSPLHHFCIRNVMGTWKRHITTFICNLLLLFLFLCLILYSDKEQQGNYTHDEWVGSRSVGNRETYLMYSLNGAQVRLAAALPGLDYS